MSVVKTGVRAKAPPKGRGLAEEDEEEEERHHFFRDPRLETTLVRVHERLARGVRVAAGVF